MEQKLAQLKTLLADITDLGRIGGLLGWDQQSLHASGRS